LQNKKKDGIKMMHQIKEIIQIPKTNFSCNKKNLIKNFLILNLPTKKTLQGKGGQNVNKVNSKVEIRFHVKTAHWIPEELRKSFEEKYSNRINSEGFFIVTSTKERSQQLNLKDCMQKIRLMLIEANYKQKERKETKVPEYEKEKRIQEKKKNSEIKKNRQVGRDDY
jgi:ribosome-associated protein